MKFAKSMMIVGALGMLAACQANVGVESQPAQTSQNANVIDLGSGRKVYFHDSQFGGFVDKQGFRTQTAQALTSVTATASTSGFVALITATATLTPASVFDVWLLRQGTSMGTVFAEAAQSGGTVPPFTKGNTAGTVYTTVQSGKNIALTIPANVPAGTYGISVTATGDTFAVASASTAVKTAFTVTDTTTFVSACYTSAGAAEHADSFTAQ